ncbi:MAG: ATP-binding cassette domain-containing protein [Akkermansia sp.]
MIHLDKVSKAYNETLVLDGVELTLPTKQVVAFIGSNGAGKSTVLNIVSRLLPATAGKVIIDDQELKQWDNRELAKRLTILGQSLHTPARLTVEELVRFGRYPHSGGKLGADDLVIVQEAMDYTGIAPLKHRYLDELSGGQRQIAYIAMAIAQDTEYILLDEPLNNLDMSRSVKVMQLLQMLVQEKNKTIFIVIHDINFVSFYADYVVALKDGVLKHHGQVNEIINSDVLKDIYDIDIDILDYQGKKLCVYYQ